MTTPDIRAEGIRLYTEMQQAFELNCVASEQLIFHATEECTLRIEYRPGLRTVIGRCTVPEDQFLLMYRSLRTSADSYPGTVAIGSVHGTLNRDVLARATQVELGAIAMYRSPLDGSLSVFVLTALSTPYNWHRSPSGYRGDYGYALNNLAVLRSSWSEYVQLQYRSLHMIFKNEFVRSLTNLDLAWTAYHEYGVNP